MDINSIKSWSWDSAERIQEIEVDWPKPSKLNHEIRSVLHALLGYLDIFEEEVKQDLDKDQIALLNRIVEYANRLTILVDDIITILRNQNSGMQNY